MKYQLPLAKENLTLLVLIVAEKNMKTVTLPWHYEILVLRWWESNIHSKICLAASVGTKKRILCSDRLPKWVKWDHLARSGVPALIPRKNKSIAGRELKSS